MLGPYIHNIDPIFGKVFGLYLWWYGLSYTLGFLHLYLFLKSQRHRLRLTLFEVYNLTLFIMIGVLVGARFIEVVFDGWTFYSQNLWLIPAYWLGGMASHGVMLGAAVGVSIFVLRFKKPFLPLADALVIPGAFLLGTGRIGNFIDGQIVGSVTDVPWGVVFPYAEEIRHPVVLYDGLKNLMLVPFLLWIRKTNRTPGATTARFVFWYAFLRIFIDLFRDYPTHRIEIGTGQMLNIFMALLGVVFLIRSRMHRLGRLESKTPKARRLGEHSEQRHGGLYAGTHSFGLRIPDRDFRRPLLFRRVALACLLLFSLTLPSNRTQDVPAQSGKRHSGLEHSWFYPEIETPVRGP